MKKVRKIFSEENTCDNEVFRSITLQPCQFEPEQKKTCANAGAQPEIFQGRGGFLK